LIKWYKPIQNEDGEVLAIINTAPYLQNWLRQKSKPLKRSNDCLLRDYLPKSAFRSYQQSDKLGCKIPGLFGFCQNI